MLWKVLEILFLFLVRHREFAKPQGANPRKAMNDLFYHSHLNNVIILNRALIATYVRMA
jgi:hypothetical protein